MITTLDVIFKYVTASLTKKKEKATEMATPIDALHESMEPSNLENAGEDTTPGSGYLLREVEKHATSVPGSLLNRLRRHELPEQIYMQKAAKRAPATGKNRGEK